MLDHFQLFLQCAWCKVSHIHFRFLLFLLFMCKNIFQEMIFFLITHNVSFQSYCSCFVAVLQAFQATPSLILWYVQSLYQNLLLTILTWHSWEIRVARYRQSCMTNGMIFLSRLSTSHSFQVIFPPALLMVFILPNLFGMLAVVPNTVNFLLDTKLW